MELRAATVGQLGNSCVTAFGFHSASHDGKCSYGGDSKGQTNDSVPRFHNAFSHSIKKLYLSDGIDGYIEFSSALFLLIGYNQLQFQYLHVPFSSISPGTSPVLVALG